MWRQDIQHTLVGSELGDTQSVVEPFALGRELQHPRAAVGAIHTTFNEPAGFELLDQQAHVGSLDANSASEIVLVDAGFAVSSVEVTQDSKLQRCEVGRNDRIRNDGDAHLIETTS